MTPSYRRLGGKICSHYVIFQLSLYFYRVYLLDCTICITWPSSLELSVMLLVQCDAEHGFSHTDKLPSACQQARPEFGLGGSSLWKQKTKQLIAQWRAENIVAFSVQWLQIYTKPLKTHLMHPNLHYGSRVWLQYVPSQYTDITANHNIRIKISVLPYRAGSASWINFYIFHTCYPWS